jgi:hypothetical protein
VPDTAAVIGNRFSFAVTGTAPVAMVRMYRCRGLVRLNLDPVPLALPEVGEGRCSW